MLNGGDVGVLRRSFGIVVETEQPGFGIAEIAHGTRSAEGCYGTGAAKRAAACPGRYAAGLLASSDDQGTCKRRWRGKHVEPSSARGAWRQAPDGKIEITLLDGTFIKVGHDVGLVTLRRVMTVLRAMTHPANWGSAFGWRPVRRTRYAG